MIAFHLPLTEAGLFIVDAILGAVNPSGRLPYKIPYNASDSTFTPIVNYTGFIDLNAGSLTLLRVCL
jgi:beta-glucosidase